MSARGPVSPRVARQRALVVDLLLATLLAVLALTVAAGIGVVAVGAVLVLLAALAWAGIEAGLGRIFRRRGRDARRATPPARPEQPRPRSLR